MGFTFFGSVADKVFKKAYLSIKNQTFVTKKLGTFPRRLPIRTDIRLSLRSLSSFFTFSLSPSSRPFERSLSRADAAFLSACRLFLDDELFKMDGRPSESMEDLRCDPPGVDREDELIATSFGVRPTWCFNGVFVKKVGDVETI